MFNSADKKLERLGFKKVEDGVSVYYERYNKAHDFTQILALVHKQNGHHIIQSYDKDLMDKKNMGNTCVGLTMYETKLCLKKMKEKGWKVKK